MFGFEHALPPYDKEDQILVVPLSEEYKPYLSVDLPPTTVSDRSDLQVAQTMPQIGQRLIRPGSASTFSSVETNPFDDQPESKYKYNPPLTTWTGYEGDGSHEGRGPYANTSAAPQQQHGRSVSFALEDNQQHGQAPLASHYADHQWYGGKGNIRLPSVEEMAKQLYEAQSKLSDLTFDDRALWLDLGSTQKDLFDARALNKEMKAKMSFLRKECDSACAKIETQGKMISSMKNELHSASVTTESQGNTIATLIKELKLARDQRGCAQHELKESCSAHGCSFGDPYQTSHGGMGAPYDGDGKALLPGVNLSELRPGSFVIFVGAQRRYDGMDDDWKHGHSLEPSAM